MLFGPTIECHADRRILSRNERPAEHRGTVRLRGDASSLVVYASQGTVQIELWLKPDQARELGEALIAMAAKYDLPAVS
jgi:hypothetical protein